MFSNLIENLENPVLANEPVPLKGQINTCLRLLGEDNPIVHEARQAVAKHGQPEDRLNKQGLLDIWKDTSLSFATKCLITLWWGHPNYRVAAKVYSNGNLNKLSEVSLEEAFIKLRDEQDFHTFKTGLEILYRDLSYGGEFHLNGIGVSFFTKFFHFYFASHSPKSNPTYLPLIADDIMRSAVFAEMIDCEEDVNTVFYSKDASLRSYTRFTDKFNDYAKKLNISPFILEDVIFNRSKGIGRVYVSSYNLRICLPHWIAGRINADEQVAIVFNNLLGETYLFEEATACLWHELLQYDYGQGLRVDEMCAELGCERFDLLCFIKELVDKRILVDHIWNNTELGRVKKAVNKSKRRFLRSSKGIGNFSEAFESVDNDYRNKILKHGLPFAASIELTYACNEACIHCYNPNSPREGGIGTMKIIPKGELEAKEYYHILDSFEKMGVAKIVFTGGDPFMKKDFIKILQYAHKLKFAISIYTNGQALFANPKRYDEVRMLYPQYIGLSLYSTIPEIHDSITRRKGSCEKTMAMARRCYEDAIGLQIKCPIMKANAGSYGKVFDFAISVNGMPQFDVNITSSVDGDCFASQRLRLDEKQLKIILQDPRIPLSIENAVGAIDRHPDMMFCGAGDASFNVQPDGTLSPCCAFPLNCGNVKEQEFELLWRESAQLKHIRALRYKNSDICGKEKFCKYCNRCIGQSFVEHGIAENHSEDNCFIAKVRYALANKQEGPRS